VTGKTVTAWADRLPVSPPVLWTGIAAGVFLAVEAMAHGVVLPLALGVVADAALTFLLIVAVAVVLAELARRHHRTVLRHGGRLSAAGVRHGSGVLAWLAAKARSRWASWRRPLLFRRAGTAQAPEAQAAPCEHAPVPCEPHWFCGCGCPGCAGIRGAEAGDGDRGPRPSWSFGHAGQRAAWPVDDPEEAHSRARQASAGGEPYVVTEYPPGGGPGRTAATYMHGKPSPPQEGNTTMPSKISTGHRAQRAARTGAAAVPSEWAAVVGQTADFEPENDGELLGWMGRQVTGLSAWAEALVDTYEHCTAVIGIDPQASAMLHDVADAAAQAAETMGAAKAKFTEHYELPREFAASGGLMTHDGRWITGDGA
jgi:hypothetical protein